MSLVANMMKKYSQSNTSAMRNPWVLGWLALVATIVLVNVGFIWASIVTMPGLVVEDYYEQGRQYEKNALKMLAAREALQWETNVEIPKKFYLNRTDVIRFSAVDIQGLPVKDASVMLHAYRPSDVNEDFLVRFDNVGPGLYQALVGFPLKGVWDLKLSITHGEDTMEMKHRLSVLVP